MRTTLMFLGFFFAVAPFSASEPNSAATVRLSYLNTYMTDWNQSSASPNVCFALGQNGRYRMLRETRNGNIASDGRLAEQDLTSFYKIIGDLASVKGSPASVVRRGSESLVLEITTSDGTVETTTWTDPDHRRPFPSGVSSLVAWLQDLKLETSRPIRDDDQSICPRPSIKPMRR